MEIELWLDGLPLQLLKMLNEGWVVIYRFKGYSGSCMLLISRIPHYEEPDFLAKVRVRL